MSSLEDKYLVNNCNKGEKSEAALTVLKECLYLA